MSITFQLLDAPDAFLSNQIEKYIDIIVHAQCRIDELKKIKKDRLSVVRYRNRLNDYAEEYTKKNKPTKELLMTIIRDLGCSERYAWQIVEMVRKRIKKIDLTKRNNQIIFLSDFMDKKELADKFKLSRQQIHRTLIKEKSSYF